MTIDDLLGRDRVAPDSMLLRRNVTGKVVLVTGAGGSIGSELCRQIIENAPASILLLDHSEFALYAIHRELSELVGQEGRNIEVVPLLGSVVDERMVNHVFGTWRPQLVFHAAAYKHVAGAALGLDPLILPRESSYIGVMIDDLVLQGVSEPYRMMTARAEYRLHLRSDNAATRLGAIGAAAGLLSVERRAHQEVRTERRAALRERLAERHVANVLASRGAPVSGTDTRSGAEWLLVAGIVPEHLGIADNDDVLEELIEDARYAPYLERQAAELASARVDHVDLAPDFAYRAVPGLSNEMVERLTSAAPETLAAAGRIQGVTPAALVAILLHHRAGKLAA